VRNIETGQEFEWPKDEFLNRLYVMKEMYQNYESGEEEWDLPPVCLTTVDPVYSEYPAQVNTFCCTDPLTINGIDCISYNDFL
jgi:hypothetical protein